ncbi:hypothetical protein BON23_5334 [Saccharomyces cerevisiae]|nr:hypothetical protein BON23_5334 [Saccharomyces cerevisiae]
MQQPIKPETSANPSLFANVMNARITDCKSKSNWLLVETIWFEFINNLTLRNGTTRNIWFIDNFPQVSTRAYFIILPHLLMKPDHHELINHINAS